MSTFKLNRKEHAQPPKLEQPFREVVALQLALPASTHVPSPPPDASLVLELPPRRKLADHPYVEIRQLELCLI